jgi:hypothetical protein
MARVKRQTTRDHEIAVAEARVKRVVPADDPRRVETDAAQAEQLLKHAKTTEQEARTPVTKMTIERVSFGARKLVTIDWDSGWKSGDAADAFVRIRPPPEATDQQVEQVRREVFQAGAKAIRILPRQKAAVIVEKKEETRKRETHREACLALVETAATQDREALKTEVEAVMAKVGM